MQIDILSSLTAAQREAATHIDGPLLMLAGPGSGKTRVVTHRVAYMLRQGIQARNILALTFTNKAADEMKLRIDRLIPGQHLWMGTFHSFCARLLRQYGNFVGLADNFSILDTKDSKKALQSAINEARLDLSHASIDTVLWEISNAKSNLRTSEEYERESGSKFSGVSEVTRQVYPVYERFLLRSNAVDFDDLLLHVAVMLRDNSELRHELDQRYKYIMVDEYQDTNLAQYAIVRALSLSNQNLSVTGDPDQSIYAWRGASISNILEFEKDYPEAKVVRLEQNYRSTKRILRAAGDLIANNRQRKQKELFTNNGEGEPVRLVCFPHPNDEADAIAARIASEVERGQRSLRDYAIFYRVNAFSRPLEHAMMKQGIPYQVVRGLEFFQRKEVKDLLSYLHLLNNPSNDVAFQRVVNLPARGIGKTSLQHVINHAQRYQLTMLEACREAGLIESLSKRAATAINKFVTLIDVLTTSIEMPVAELLVELVEETGYGDYVDVQDAKADEDRRGNVDELINAAREFEREMEESTLEAFLEHVALVSDVDDLDVNPDRVTLMTMHAAKGLEFPSVFIVGVEHGILPHERSLEDHAAEEEERRLLFVGVTRAEKQLQLSYCQRRTFRGQTRIASPSQFLYELPRDEMECHIPTGGLSAIGLGSLGSEYELEPDFLENLNSDHDVDQTLDSYYQGDPSENAVPSPLEDLADQLQTAAQLLGKKNGSNRKASSFRSGMQVHHDQYGIGVVLAITGKGAKRTATVEFANHQERKFRLAFAPLTPIDDSSDD
ncbi:MAG: UvrD-helicase domain-containing protein [Planctomycetota bacterium]|nr:UvrD-helicase domain-containing protein [Planctomycetota bacterium]